MFTLSDVRNIAVQIEKNGEETYRRVAAQVKDLELAQLFTWMAEEEKRHGELFAAMIDDRQFTAEQAELEAVGRSLLQDIVRSQTFSLEEEQLKRTTNLEALLAQSVAFENDTIDFYEFLAGFLDDPKAIQQLATIIEQEREHVRHLEEMRANAKSLAAYEIEL